MPNPDALMNSPAAALPPRDPPFRMRGKDVSRLECFSDAVFGFALTLLVVSLDVPSDFDELVRRMRSFPAFAICFALLLYVWWQHYRFFRRYALQDGATIVLNSALLFAILFFVYPLKYLFVSLVGLFGGGGGSAIRVEQIPSLFAIYGLGSASIWLLLALLHGHALRRGAALELTPIERWDTGSTIRENALLAGFGLLSALLAGQLPLAQVGLAGWCYMGIPPAMALHGAWRGRGRAQLWRKQLAASAAVSAVTVAAKAEAPSSKSGAA